MAGSLGGAICMYYIGAYIKIADPVHHVTAKLSSGGISAMAFFYLWTSECPRSSQSSSVKGNTFSQLLLLRFYSLLWTVLERDALGESIF
jgi:hypothetical protein